MKRKSVTDAQLAVRTAQAVELVDTLLGDLNNLSLSIAYAPIRANFQTALTALKGASSGLISKV